MGRWPKEPSEIEGLAVSFFGIVGGVVREAGSLRRGTAHTGAVGGEEGEDEDEEEEQGVCSAGYALLMGYIRP